MIITPAPPPHLSCAFAHPQLHDAFRQHPRTLPTPEEARAFQQTRADNLQTTQQRLAAFRADRDNQPYTLFYQNTFGELLEWSGDPATAILRDLLDHPTFLKEAQEGWMPEIARTPQFRSAYCPDSGDVRDIPLVHDGWASGDVLKLPAVQYSLDFVDHPGAMMTQVQPHASFGQLGARVDLSQSTPPDHHSHLRFYHPQDPTRTFYPEDLTLADLGWVDATQAITLGVVASPDGKQHPGLRFYCGMLGGARHLLRFPRGAETTVGELRAWAAERGVVGRFIFAGRMLEDDVKTLGEYDLTDGAIVLCLTPIAPFLGGGSSLISM